MVARFTHSPTRAPSFDTEEGLDWLAWRFEERQAEGLQISPKTVPLLVRAVRCLAATYADQSYLVEARDKTAPGHVETMARGSHALVMIAAYEAACTARPGASAAAIGRK